jgi:glycosyltransferase involved in cell wall biosynthesis
MYNYEYPPIGGGGGIAHHLIAAELARRHEVTVVTSAFGDLPRSETMEGVQVLRIPVIGRTDRATGSLASLLSYPVAAVLHARGLLRRRSFDVINSHFAVPTGVGSLAVARRAGVPHIQTIHGGDIYDPSKKLSPHRNAATRWAVRRVLLGSDVVVAQSSDTRRNAHRFYDVGVDIQIIPLSVRIPDHVPHATRDELGLDRDVFWGITVGRLVLRKRVDRLITALTQEGCEKVRLIVVGEGPEKPSLERLAASLGVSERVRFTGHAPEILKWQLLRAADAYLSSTEHEGYGLVFLEGMAMGLPVIAPDHGGQVDFLEDGKTGYVVAANEAPALADAIRRLARSPELARSMGENNRVRFARNHRLADTAARYEELFNRLIDSPAAVSSPTR